MRSGNFDGVSRSVGVDLVSSELLLEVSEVPGGFGHLLEWYNRVLATQVIPEHWNQPVLVMLPKVAHPQLARDLRTIAMGSAVSKVFSKMLLARLKRGIAPVTPAQCASAGRQTGDYVYTLWKLMELSREWGTGFAALKLDLSKAFDSLRREPLLQKIRPLVTCQAEFACWQGLLNNVVGLLQTPWGSSSVPMDVGIKQGAPESPALFSFMAEQALLEASTEHAWSDQARVFPGLDPEEILYMDDGVLWTHDIPRLRVRVIQLQAALLKYGLRLNLAKCQLYCAPTCQGPRNMHLDGVTLADAGHLDVMGVRMRVGMTIYELVAPFAARAKEKFWEIRHILQAKGSVKARVRVMQRIIGATALWCIGAIPPDKGAQSLLNTVQLQILIWMLRLGKRDGETWDTFRKRAFRTVRSILHSSGCDRWSTLWASRYWRFAGHRVRGLLREVPVASSLFEDYRTLSWWRVEQQRPPPHGLRHQKHFARYTKLETMMDTVCRGPWRDHAHDRNTWKSLESRWLDLADIPWASGRQLSLRDH